MRWAVLVSNQRPPACRAMAPPPKTPANPLAEWDRAEVGRYLMAPGVEEVQREPYGQAPYRELVDHAAEARLDGAREALEGRPRRSCGPSPPSTWRLLDAEVMADEAANRRAVVAAARDLARALHPDGEARQRRMTVWNSLRRTFAALLYERGEDPVYVMDQLGHTDPKLALRIYTKVVSRQRRRGVKANGWLPCSADLSGAARQGLSRWQKHAKRTPTP
jgi:hypothetical protein